MLRRRNKKDKPLSMEHYAPKITFTALDYFLPFSYERYMKEAEARIKETLSKTELDAMGGAYFDPYAFGERQVFLSMLRQQTPQHDDANRSIADKHAAELQRLDSAILRTNKLIAAYEQEMAALQDLYDRNNS